MRIESFCAGQRYGGGADASEPSLVAAHHRCPLHEIENAEAGGKPRAAFGRQDVVGAGDVIADCLRGEAAEEYRTGVAHRVGQLVGVVDRKFEMLGRQPVDQR